MFLQRSILFLLMIQLKVSIILCQNNHGDCVSCSVASMEKLLQMERNAVLHLEKHIKKLQDKIDVIRSGLENLRTENEKSKIDEEAYLSNPLNAYSLIHRLRFDWYDWETFLQHPIGTDEIENLDDEVWKMPTSLEFTQAVHNIYRLQKFYYITAKDMANGVLNGTQYDAKFSLLDAFAIARNMFSESEFEEANEWIEEALRLYTESPLNDIFESNQSDLYAFYAEIQLKLGNEEKNMDALVAIENAQSLDPFNTKLNQRINDIEFDSYVHFQSTNNTETNEGSEIIREYSANFCRQRSVVRINNLHCRLYNKVNDFVKLAPFKVEELSLNPYVVKFYDIISDKEIVHLKEMTRQNLRQAMVVSENGTGSVDDSRTSKTAWLKDNATKIVSNINERISDMTGFDLENSESLQIMNYGIAGLYFYHTDYLDLEKFKNFLSEEDVEYGDRIATVLIYMSDVTDGGETIFPSIETVVKPQKGTALVWYNLDDKGDHEPGVGHIACPVILGSKWAATKWILERNQFRARPCLKVKQNGNKRKT